MTLIAVIGMAGSGKSTLCSRIAERSDLTHVVTGDIVRDLAKTDPDVQAALDRGMFAPRDKMNVHFIKYIERECATKHLLLDGYPRYRDQLFDLYIIAQSRQIPTILINVECDPYVARRRLLARQRDDDHIDAINQRLASFIEETYPLVGLWPIIFDRNPQIWTVKQGSEVEMQYQILDKAQAIR